MGLSVCAACSYFLGLIFVLIYSKQKVKYLYVATKLALSSWGSIVQAIPTTTSFAQGFWPFGLYSAGLEELEKWTWPHPLPKDSAC